jgi:hypothetical protein
MIESVAFLLFNLGIFGVIAWAWKQDDLSEQRQESECDL